ncbi:MAG: PD-(D/E)XK nuclease family protein, partial [Vicinamibacterales bacterium]
MVLLSRIPGTAPGAGWVMDVSRPFQIVESASAAARLEAAAAFLRSFPPSQPITVVGATRGAADDLARRIAAGRGATIGLARFSLTQLAARVASTRLAGRGVAPATLLGSEAVAARVAFDARAAQTLAYFGEVASTPGFPRALAQTIGDLRAASVGADRLARAGSAGVDLARLLAGAEREFLEASTADRVRLFDTAADAVDDDGQLAAPLLLLDVPLEAPYEARFVAALARRSTHICATVPARDAAARDALTAAGGTLVSLAEQDDTVLARLRGHLFADTAPAPRETDASLQFFSAPGEGREAVEIARRVLAEARRGVRFDEMAILLRAPQHYHGLLEHALERASIPAWFDRSTRRPHPAGRAFLALLACAAEHLSARRFAEYLSLGQVPSPDDEQTAWAPAGDEVLAIREEGRLAPAPTDPEVGADAGRPDETGTLPAPRRWEQMLVEASVIGGNADRWARRLTGLERELERRGREAERQGHDDQAAAIARDRERLQQLRAFALPLVEQMAAWPAGAPWGEWLDRLAALAPRVLQAPAFVLRVLADLRPMSTVGPVTLDEVRSVLSDRLRLVESEPPARRYGRVFVGSPAQARGRSFRVVFVPGLAERMFPQKPRQDPLLVDAARERVDPALGTRAEQGRRERLLLHLAVGAATERLYVSYPRLEIAEGRGRVPSFYALDVLRGATGRIPDHEALAGAAAAAGDPSLAWPAPADPALAIDDQEHDLSVLRSLLDARDPIAVRGHAQYILKQNPALKRSVTDRWARAEKRWSPYDGITRAAAS